MNKALDILNDIWLKDGKKFLTGDEISIADLCAVCELTQVSDNYLIMFVMVLARLKEIEDLERLINSEILLF